MNTDPSGLSPRKVTPQEGIIIGKMIEIDFLQIAANWPGYTVGDVQRQYPITHGSKHNHQGRRINMELVDLPFLGVCLLVFDDPNGGEGKPDIVDFKKQEIYEVKSLKSESKGHAEIYWYSLFLNGSWNPGSFTYPGKIRTIGIWPGYPDYVIRAEIRQGVIVYWGAKLDKTRDHIVEEYETEDAHESQPVPTTTDPLQEYPNPQPAPTTNNPCSITAETGDIVPIGSRPPECYFINPLPGEKPPFLLPALPGLPAFPPFRFPFPAPPVPAF